MTERNVTVIPATKTSIHRMPGPAAKKRRVAGYARVSTDKDEQYTSYEAQVDYYTQFIRKHANWEFVKVYTDEGISGLGTRKRDGFNEMIEDAMSGTIDLIITKSVSRFARNTVDSLVTIRKLKDKGVEVYFEKENIYSLDGKGELLLTIMSSLAQEESRSISENVTWGQRKRFSDGKVSLPYKQFLGYERGEKKDDPPVVNQEQAVIVRRIYRTFMEGKTVGAIAKELTAEGVPTPSVTEDEIKSRFLKVFNSIISSKKPYISACLTAKKAVTDTSRIDTEMNDLLRDMEVVAGLTKKCIEENSTTVQDQEEYTARYNGYVDRYETLKSRYDALAAERECKLEKAKAIDRFIHTVKSREDLLTEFDPRLWMTTVENVTIMNDGKILFRFFDGNEIIG